MSKRIILFLGILIAFCFDLKGQLTTYKMQDTTVTDCDGILTDSDALFGGLYGSNEDFTFKICPGTGATISFVFSMLRLEIQYDTIFFYDGPNTSSTLIAFYLGQPAPLPPTIIATSGCMTIRFVSDGTLQLQGWNAVWNSTSDPIIPPLVNVSTTSPPTCDSTSFMVEFDKNIHCDSIDNLTGSLNGFNAPNIVNIASANCIGDSTRFARIWMDTSFIYNCEYELEINYNERDVCDSLYQFILKDTFDFTTCKLLTQITSTHDSICYGDCADLEIINIANCNNFSYVWSNGLPSNAGPHTVCPLNTTTYYVTVTESNSGIQYEDSIEVKVLDTLDKELGISVAGTAETPTCNSRWFRVKFDRSIPCSLLDSGFVTISSTAGNSFVLNRIPLNCVNGKLDSARFRLNVPLIQNCEYRLEFNWSFTDSCEGLISIIARDTFLITDCQFTLTSTYDDSICPNDCSMVSVAASGCDGYNYVWSNGLPNSPGPFNICPVGDTAFHVAVTEISTGLVLRDTIRIKVFNPSIMAVLPVCNSDAPFNLISQTPGGNWSGNGITNANLGTFDPSIAGGGNHSIYYSIDGCLDSTIITVIEPDAGPDTATCASGIPINLNAGSPAGGVWSGVNVNSTASTFTPTSHGNYIAYYTVSGCVDSINIMVDTILFQYYYDTVCGSAAPITIPFSPSGGNWSGPGITSSSAGIFNPGMANNGNNKVAYSYRGCSDTINFEVVLVNAGPDTNACPSQPPFNLSPGFPASGIWSGTGITNVNIGSFDPATNSGNWMSDIVYTFEGCTDTVEMSVIQTNIIQDTLYFCPSQDSILIPTITGLTTEPNYGSWFGIGVKNYGSSYYLYPKSLGNGYHRIYYSKNTCQDSVVIAIYPDTLSYRDSTVCDAQNAFLLDPINNMPGATWSGTGITNSSTGLFDPSVASTGVNTITYLTQGNVCNKTINMTVYSFVPAQINLPDSLCFVNQNRIIPAVPAGGLWSGFGNYNQTAGTINTSTAGSGYHNLIYSFGTGACFTSDTANVFVRDSITPDLKVSSDTICLGTSVSLIGSATGGYPSPNYQYSWSHSSSNSSTLTDAPSSTTVYTLTVNDGCSDANQVNKEVVVLSVNPTLIASSPLCFGELGYATFDVSQKSIYNFTWTKPTTAGDTVYAIVQDTAFLTVTNNFGCSVDTFIEIPGYDYLKADFDLDPDKFPNCLSSENKSLRVIDNSTGAVTGSWDFGDGTNITYNPANSSETYTYVDGGNFVVSLIIQNNGPCFDTLTRKICVSEEQFFIADIFSPNGDGVNDILYVRSSEILTLDFIVFDRWGKLVFRSNNVNNGWDGTFKGREMESGVYFYTIVMTLVNGEELKVKGDVTLIR